MKKKTKNLLSFLTTLVCILSITITSSAQYLSVQDEEPLHYMGAIPDSPDNIARHLLDESVSTYSVLPSSVDNSYLYPTPLHQNGNYCVAYAIGYAQMSGMQALNRGWTVNTNAHKFSPAFLNNLIFDPIENGAYFAQGMNAAIRYGISPSTYYAIDTPFGSPTPNIAYEAAALYKPTTYYVTSTLTQIKQAIAEGKGVVTTIHVYDDMYYDMEYDMAASNYTYDEKYGIDHGIHAICLVGYDDSEQAFKFINSWGDNWCQDGFGWISYDFINSDIINAAGACHGYVMVFPENDNYIMGDANLDNVLNASDGRLALRFSAGVETPTDRQFVLSDVDGDGVLTATDAQNIVNYVSHTINKLPIYE